MILNFTFRVLFLFEYHHKNSPQRHRGAEKKINRNNAVNKMERMNGATVAQLGDIVSEKMRVEHSLSDP